MNGFLCFKKSITIIVFVSTIVKVGAQNQITQFQTGYSEYLEDLEKYLISNMDKKEAKNLHASFSQNFNSKLNDEQKKAVITTTNKLFEKKIKFKPDFKNYVESIDGFCQKKDFYSEKRFNDWMNILTDQLKSRNKTKAVKFLSFSQGFFVNKYLYKSSSSSWSLLKGDFEFHLDKVPYMKFVNADIKLDTKNDSSIIYETNATYNVSTNQWVGKTGKVTWERVKLSKNKFYAALNNYKFSLKTSGFSADSVMFYSTYFSEPILGRLREKVVTLKDYKKANYPEFSSFNQNLSIKNIFNQVDYEGAFRMKGARIQGGAEGNKKALVTVREKGKTIIIVEAKNIIIEPNGISAPKARTTVFIYGGEIVNHPSALFKYKKDDDEFSIIREGEATLQSAFESTFHQLDMHFEVLKWKRGDNQLRLGALKGNIERKAFFESKDYFSINNYNEYQGPSKNILYDLYKYYKQSNEDRHIPALAFANRMKLMSEQLEPMLARMNSMGIIYYSNDTIYVKDRLEKYIKAKSKRGDYDDIRIMSEVKAGDNAFLSLTNNDLTINGIKGFPINRFKNVKIFPKEGTIVLKKNRDIDFSGVINAGRVELFGDGLSFIYDDFKVNIPLADTMRIRVWPINNSIQQKEVRLLSRLEQIQGTLYLDDPGNKSGVDTNFYDFPKIDITNETYVYYDAKSIQNGAYDRNDFKFKVYPFKMDSLSFFSTGGLTLKGKLYSAGIFNVMEGELTVQQDYSLGFIIDNVNEKIYSNRANYTNLLVLNSKGLQGKGGLSFLTSTAQSDDIVFFPDSLVAIAQTYENKGQSSSPNVPAIKANNVKITYQPKKGIWTAQSMSENLKIFDDKITSLKGSVELTKAGMTGQGEMSFNQIDVISYSFKLKERTIDADTCEFIIKGRDPKDPLSFQAVNMNMHIDFDTRIGDFVSNDGNSYLEFPDNRFICYMDKFQWFMDTDEMGLANEDKDSSGFNINTDLEISEPNFFSTHPKQDSLAFASNSARYDLKKKTLICYNIPYIPIADARIYPDSGFLIIKRKAHYVPLEKAKVIANSVTKYHTFTGATIQLESKKYYSGSGNYSASDDSTLYSNIFFHKIEANKEQITVAEGDIVETANFSISPEFKFYGKAYINASELGVSYDGKTSIVHDCRNLASGWIDFKSKIDTSNVLIELGSDFKDFTSGVMLYSEDSIGYYSSFLARKENATDHTITPTNGWLGFNRETKEFQIGPKKKIEDLNNPGNYVSLNTENCSVFADGLIDFANSLGQMEVEPIGQLSYDTTREKILTINGSMSFNFPFNKEAISSMGIQLSQLPDGDPIDFNRVGYEKIIKRKLNQKKSDKAISDLNLYGKMSSFPKELECSISILGMQIYWNSELKAFVSNGDAVIGNVGSHQVFKKAKVSMMLEKKRNGDILHLYIEPLNGMFYYFNYKAGILQTVGTNSRFNELIINTKPKKSTFKARAGLPSFQYMNCSKSKPLLFLRKIEELVEAEEETDSEEKDPFSEEKIGDEESNNNNDIKEEKSDAKEEDKGNNNEEENEEEDDW